MNDSFEQEIRYKILKLLSAEPHLSQRAMAAEMGISLGKTNYVLSELGGDLILRLNSGLGGRISGFLPDELP